MRLSDQAGGIGLWPLRYQFPTAHGDRWDDNWLTIEAEVTTPALRWSFRDAFLQVDEARDQHRQALVGGRMAKHWRKGHYRNGKYVKGHWVGGSHPKAGCVLLMVGMVSLAALVRSGTRRS